MGVDVISDTTGKAILAQLSRIAAALESMGGSTVTPATIDENGVVSQAKATIDENGIVTFPNASMDENGVVTI